MPTNRTRKTRGRKIPGLLESERHFLLTGECTPDPKKHGIKDWRDIGEGWVRPFILSSPAGREELRALWKTHRDELMRTWTGKRKPWAAREFDNERKKNAPDARERIRPYSDMDRDEEMAW